MVKAYLKYEQVAAFGVVASNTAAVLHVPNSAGAPLIAAAAVDIVVVWNLRTGDSVLRLGNIDTRKAGHVSALAVSKEGETIAAGYSDGSIRLWDVNLASVRKTSCAFDKDEPQPLVSFNGHRSGVLALSFDQESTRTNVSRSSDPAQKLRPTMLASGSSDGDVIIWNVLEGSGDFRILAHTDAITSIILFRNHGGSPHVVSGSKDGLVKVFDVDAQHCIQTIVGHRTEVWAMALDPTNTLLVTGSSDAEVRGFFLSDAAMVEGAAVKAETILQLKDSPPNQVFTEISSVQRHIAADRVSSMSFTTHSGQIYLIVTGADKTAELFRLRTCKNAEIHRKRREKRHLASLEKEAEAQEDDDGVTQAFKKKQYEEKQKNLPIYLEAVDFLVSARHFRMGKKLRSICFLPESMQLPVEKAAGVDLQLVVQSKDNALEVYRTILRGSGKSKKRGRSGSDGKVDNFPSSSAGDVKELLALDFPGHRKDVRSVSLAPDDTTLLSTSDGSLNVWNLATQKCVRAMHFKGYGLCTSLLGADGRIGVVGTKDGKLLVYDLGSGNLITQEDHAHSSEIWSLCLDDHIYEAGVLVSGGSDKKVCFWGIGDILTGTEGKLKLLTTFELPDEVLCVKVAFGMERPVVIVSLMDSTVRAYYMDTLEPYLSFYGHRLPVMCLDISSDGLILATGSADKTIKLWGMDFGDCRRSLRGHSESILSLAFQPNTHYLFTGSRDGSLKYWDGDKFEFICDIEGQRGEVWSVATSSDGEIIATASHDRMLRVWRRTDQPLFLEEERDKRMDEVFESALIQDDLKEAAKNRKQEDGLLKDLSKSDALAAGKRSIDTVKGGEKLLEALQLCEEEKLRKSNDGNDAPNPMLLGLSVEAYLLRILKQIKTADLEEALHILPLDAAVQVLEYCCRLLDHCVKESRLSTEMLSRVALYLIKLHHGQITAGAASRKLISDLRDCMLRQVESNRKRMGFNGAALHFWEVELGDRDDGAFRDASSRAHNLQRKRTKRIKA